jgi:hypothetical protein
MSNPSPTNPSQHWDPPPPRAFRPPSRWPTFVTLAIALIGVAVGFVGWFRPLPHTNLPPRKPTYTAQQIADAKANVCAAFGKIDHGVDLSDAEGRGSTDRGAQLAAAALDRQVLDFGSRYLFAKVAQEPAIPSELGSAVRQQANAFQELLVGYINGAAPGDPSLTPTQKASDGAADTIRRLCK